MSRSNHAVGVKMGSSRKRCRRVVAAVEPLESRRLLSAGLLTGATQKVSFAVGPDAADPVRNVVYIADNSDQRIIALNTDTGNTIGVISLAANATGIAVSPDDSRLYVAESTADRIEVFSLPDNTLLKTLNVGVPVGQVAAIANSRVAGEGSSLNIFDGNTGKVLSTLSADYSGEIKASLDGKILYSRQRGLSGGTANVRRWNVSGTGAPVAMTAIPGPSANSTDFVVDPGQGRAYLSDGGVYGLTEVNIATGTKTFWPFNKGPYGYGVAEFPGSQYVYGPSYGDVEQFNQNGVVLNTFSFNPIAKSDSLVITPNNHLVFASAGAISIIGVANLSINPAQSQPPHLVFTVQPKATVAGKAVAPAVVVAIENAQNQVITSDNSAVTLAVNSGPGSLQLTVNAHNGIATFSNVVLTKVGSYTLRATDGSDTAAISNTFAVVPAAAAKLVFATPPANSQVGAFVPPIVANAQDAFGNLATTANAAVTLSVASGPGQIYGLNTVNLVKGVATFDDVWFHQIGSYKLAAKSGSLTSATTSSFSIAAGAPFQMVFTTIPTTNVHGATFTVKVTAKDAFGNVVTSQSKGTVTLSLAFHPLNSKLNGTLSANFVKGVATVSNLSFNIAGKYTLTASDNLGLLAITSAQITVS